MRRLGWITTTTLARRARHTSARPGRNLAALLLVLLVSLAGAALAQGFTGRFSGEVPIGLVTLTLEASTQGLTGVLEAPGVRLVLEGAVEDGVGFGYAYGGDEVLGFEAYLQGTVLGLYVFELDASGNALVDSAVELLLDREPTQPVPGASPTTAPPDPFAAPAAGQATLDGTYADERITLSLRTTATGYAGEVGTAEQRYVLEGVATADGLRGTFSGNGFTYAFVAVAVGDGLRFESSGAVYDLRRIDRAPAAVDGPPTPFGTAAPDTTIVARGSAAELSRDDALAFLEALEFVLDQLGYAYRFSEAERSEALTTFARTFPTMDAVDQVVLAQARTIWERVRANWHRSDERERREFALGVLILAFGDETVASWVGPQGSGGQGQALGQGSGCASFDDCAASFVDQQTWTDTFNAQGCWAAAGCESYDSGSGTFTYSDDW